MNKDTDVLVVGGGISGLSTAWWLAQQGVSVQVWEKSTRAGGKIKTDSQDGYITEQAASMLMNFKPEVDEFLYHSGIDLLKEKRLLDSNSKRYLIHKGKLHPLPMTISGVCFSSLWSTSGKFRLLMEPFISKAVDNNESVSHFITRRFGKEFLEKAMEPFIAGTLASDPDLANALHVIPRLSALEKRFGSITAGIIMHKIMGKRTARNPEAFSFHGGMQTLVQQLANNPSLGFQSNIQVHKIIQHGNHNWEVQAQSEQEDICCKAQHIVISSPADSAAQLLEQLNPQLSKLLTTIKYAPLSVVHIGLQQAAIKHPLDSIGFLVPRQEQQQNKISINGNLWMSSVFANRSPSNQVLLSSYLGGARNPSASKLSNQQSIDHVMQDIRPLLGLHFDTTPIMARVDKHTKALPLYHGDYHHKLCRIEEQLQKLPGLYLQANYKGGISVRDRISEAKKVAANIIKQLNSNDCLSYQSTNYIASHNAQTRCIPLTYPHRTDT
jgi:protoporphyrinogen/coproporphyrinogen III oxidase